MDKKKAKNEAKLTIPHAATILPDTSKCEKKHASCGDKRQAVGDHTINKR